MDSEKRRETLKITEINGQAWTYAQKTGELEHDGEPVATGYSGCGKGKNNPDMQPVHNIGPVPQGDWTISGPPENTSEHGPYVLRLTPMPETETFGRAGFLIHGDSKTAPGSASQGCVILPRSVREKVWESGDHDLEVVAELPNAAGNKK